VRIAGSSEHREYWIPAADLEKLNENIVGAIESPDGNLAA